MIIISAVLWGTYGSFVTVITGMGMQNTPLVFLRFVATVIPVGILMFIKDRSLFKIHAKDLWLFAANGILSIVFFTLCYTAAIGETKIATAAALLYTAPAIVLVFSAIIFAEKLTPRKIICVVVAVIGCALVSGLAGGSLALTPKGLLLGLGAGLGYALYSIFSRLILNRGYSPYTNVFYTFGIAIVVFACLCFAEGSASQIIELPGATALALLCGLLTGCVSYVLYTTGLAGFEVSKAAQLATIEPVTATVLGFVLFGQTLSISEIAGIVLVVGSVIAMNAKTTSREAVCE